MPITISNVVVNTHTFANFITYFNEVADHMTNNVVSIGTEATGDANVNGTIYSVGFQSNVVTANNGTIVVFTSNTMQTNVATIANGTGNFSSLKVSNNDVWHANNFDPTTKIEANDTIAFTNSITFSESIKINSSSVGAGSKNLTTTSANLITSFDTTVYNGAKLVVTVSNPTTNNYSMTELLVTHNNVNAYVIEYAQIYSNTSPGDFSSNINANTLRLYYTPTVVSNTIISYQETLV